MEFKPLIGITYEFIFQLVNTFLIFFILKKLLFKPVLGIIEAREKDIRENLAQGERSKKEGLSLKSEYEEKLKYLYRSKEGTSAHIFISDFYFDPDELKIAFTSYSLGDYTYILFKKDSDGDMKGIKGSGYHDPNDIMVICGGIISEADIPLKYKKILQLIILYAFNRK